MVTDHKSEMAKGGYTLNVFVNSEIKEQLANVAEAENKTISDVIRDRIVLFSDMVEAIRGAVELIDLCNVIHHSGTPEEADYAEKQIEDKIEALQSILDRVKT